MPKYYVNFGKDYQLVLTAKTPKEACKKTLQRYLEKDALTDTTTDTLTTPDRFKVSESGFVMWNKVNNDDYHEYSHQEISKLLDDNKGSGGSLAYA